MTDEKGETWSPSGMSKVRSGPESLVADSSMHALQPPERCGRQGYPDESTALVVSWCQQSGDIDERRSLMSAAGCQTGTPVRTCSDLSMRNVKAKFRRAQLVGTSNAG